MNVLITGGAGFIGSHVAERAIAMGHHVSVLDNESTGKRSNVHPQASYYFADICHQQLITDICKEEKPEIVVHLAAQSEVPASVKNPLNDALINVIGMLNLLEAVRACGVRKVIFSSTAAVYGDQTAYPLKEEWAGRLLSPYAVSKYAGERYLELYLRLYGLTYTMFRFANVYGPRQSVKADGSVIAYFLDSIEQNRELPVHGDGEQTRDFIYVEDVAEAIVRTFHSADNTLLNLSTGTPTSINQLLTALETIVQKPITRRYGPERDGDIRHSYLCNDKLTYTLRWQPEFSLYNGLLQTWQKRI